MALKVTQASEKICSLKLISIKVNPFLPPYLLLEENS